jgi:O-antigen/teichoic acid export membrane protein
MHAYLACEVAWNATFLGFAYWLVQDGIAGAGPAYVAGYAVYLAVLVFRTRRHHRYAFTARILALWIAGACVVLLTSAVTWTDAGIVWPKAGLILIAGLLSWLAVTPAERGVLRVYVTRLLAR